MPGSIRARRYSTEPDNLSKSILNPKLYIHILYIIPSLSCHARYTDSLQSRGLPASSAVVDVLENPRCFQKNANNKNFCGLYKIAVC